MSDTFYRTLIESLYDGVYYVDRDMRITLWNRGAEAITGYTRHEIGGSRCSDNFLRHIDEHGTPLCTEGCPLAETLKDGKTREAEVFLHHKDGHRLPVSVRIAPIRDEAGEITGAVEIFSDTSLLANKMDALSQLALTDGLTGVRNRAWAETHLRTGAESARLAGVPFGIILIDADHFKAVNDTHGHLVGDRVLKMLARTVQAGLRRSDACVRWGGEEFLGILHGADAEDVTRIAERVRMLVENAWLEIDTNLNVSVTVSIGGSVLQNGETVEQLYARADEALYASKRGGRNRVTVSG